MNASDAHPSHLTTGMVTLLHPKSEAEVKGVLRHFLWRGDETEVSGDVSRTDAGLVISSIEVRPSTPSGITHRLLHRVPLGEILAEVRADLARYDMPASDTPIPPGRVLIDDNLLRQVAMAYLEETGPGKDRAVLQRLERRFGRPKGTIRTWIKRAREEGWLGAALQGRMGTEPGPKLMAWRTEEFKRDHPGVISHVVKRPDGSARDVSEPFSIHKPDDHETGAGED